MSASNQQTLADSGANERPPMLEKMNYIPWESKFRRFLDNKLKEEEWMWHSVEKGPYVRPMIPDPDDTREQIIEPLSKMTEINKKQYIADVRVMNYLHDIYNSVDASSKAKKVARNHDPLARIAHSNDSSSQSHANPSYSNSSQPYYVTHPSLVVDYEEDYQGELQGDSQEEKITTAMMLLARAITQKFSTPSNNHLRTSSNTRNQAVIQDGRVDIQTKNVGYGRNGNRSAERQNRNQAFNAGNRLTQNDESNQIVHRVPQTESNPGKTNVQCYNCNKKGHYARDCQKPKVRDAKYFKEQMLLAMKDEARSNLNTEENYFMLDNCFGDEILEELTVAIIMMAQIQQADDNAVTKPTYDAKAVSKLAKKAFKERENRYLDDIVDLEEKLSSHDRIVYKMGQSIQTIHMHRKTPNKVYDPFIKVGLGYQNPERLKKAIAAQPKMYHGEMLQITKLKINSPDYEETLEDVKESRLKMRNKMVQLDYEKLNAFYETFVPQKEPSVEQTYFSFPSTSNECSESNEVMSNLQIPKMPKESKLLKMFEKMGLAINDLRDRIDVTLLEDRKRRWMSDSQNSLREFYKTDVILMSVSLSKTLKELQQELIEEVQKIENIKLEYQNLFNSIKATRDQHQQEVNELIESISQKAYSYGDVRSKNQDLLMVISELKNKLKAFENGKGVESSNSIRRPKSKDTKSNNRVLKNTNDKSSSAHDQKMSSSVSTYSNKRETMNSTVCQSNASVLNTKNVNAVNDGSNIVCVSCGKDVFMLSYEKYVARYALSRDSKVKRALFTTPIASKSKNLEATSLVAKSRFSVAKTLTATTKVSSALSLSPASSQSRTLSNYMKNKIATSQKWQKWFEYQPCFNWTPKSKTAQSTPSVSKSSTSVQIKPKTPVTT
ncbi:retrovirus-related pol polyprotein from transposon TNT 1-94 [Tanacetum coccineum]